MTETVRADPEPAGDAGVHHHLVREGTRTRCALVLESGDAREVHHVALLIGYGAGAVNPYLAFETLDDMIRQRVLADVTGLTHEKATVNYIKALNKGILKVMSKMGISTLQSYCGAQIFEAIGLEQAFVDKYFTWTPSRIGGVGIDVIAQRSRSSATRARFRRGRRRRPTSTSGGEYKWRRDGEQHLFNPETVHKLQHATRSGQYAVYRDYTNVVNDQSRALGTLRGLLDFKADRTPVPLDEVEPVEAILKRFATGAMSYGSISQEAHETLAIAMNRLGGKSNTGEGGEDPARYTPRRQRRLAPQRDQAGRVGALRRHQRIPRQRRRAADQDGAGGEARRRRPAAGPQGLSVDREGAPLDAGRGADFAAAASRHLLDRGPRAAHSRPEEREPAGAGHVKLVAEVGVGTVAAGVAKAHADVVLISGHDGGTGASPLTSIKHAGIPWELGLAETQQVLLLNRLRDRIVVQVDGQLKTGRDVVIAALLGAEEFGFATAALVVSGCIMMRVCHLNTCPVGVATQDPELRKKFTGKPEFVVNYFRFVAEEVRELMAPLGFRTMDEMVGRVDVLETTAGARPLEGQGDRLCRTCCTSRRSPSRRRAMRFATQDHGLEQGARRRADRARVAGRSSTGAGRDRAADPQRQPHRRHDARLRDHAALRRQGTARRHDPDQLHRIGGPELRRLRAARHHDDARGRRERLLRQGTVGRQARRVSVPPRRRSRRRRTSSSATCRSTARPAARRTSAASPASGSRSATAARSPSWKAWAITAANT